MHDRLEKRGSSLLHGFLEGQSAGYPESDIGRIDVVIFAVVEADAEVGHWKASQISCLSRFAYPSFHGRNPVLGNRATEEVVHKLNSSAARQGFHLDATNAELPVATGLFLVLAFRVGLGANGFAIGHLGRVQGELDVIALAELGHDDFDVLLAGTGEQKFLGLRIAAEVQGRVFFENFVDGDADAVFVGASLGLDGKGDRRLGNTRARVVNHRRFVAQGVVGQSVFQFSNRADVTRVQLGNFQGGFALHDMEMLEALGGAAIVIVEGGVVLHGAGHDFEEGDAAGERVGNGFVDEDGARLGGSDFALDGFALAVGFLMAADYFANFGRGQNFGDEIEDGVIADVVQG